MEDGLVLRKGFNRAQQSTQVLILVVMEDGLVPIDNLLVAFPDKLS